LKKYFYDEDNPKLKGNNENFRKIYFVKFNDYEEKEINLEIENLKEISKVIFIIGKNCDIIINKLVKLKNSEICGFDFVSILNNDSKLKLKSIFVSEDNSKGEFFERIFCMNEDCKVELEIKSVSKAKSSLYCEAGAFIDRKAKGSDVNILEKGIILENGKIDFFPNLKIENNDVKASHAASTFRISEDDLFYIQSRGVSELNAKELFLEEFLNLY